MSRTEGGEGRIAWRFARPFLPGALIILTIYGVTVWRGGRFLFEERFLIMQALDPRSLSPPPPPL